MGSSEGRREKKRANGECILRESTVGSVFERAFGGIRVETTHGSVRDK